MNVCRVNPLGEGGREEGREGGKGDFLLVYVVSIFGQFFVKTKYVRFAIMINRA